MRMIDADALLENNKEFADREFEHPMYQATLRELIDDAPTIDAVSVVRCKECKHYDKFPTWSACTYWSGDPYEQAGVNDDDFCSYGEREGE